MNSIILLRIYEYIIFKTLLIVLVVISYAMNNHITVMFRRFSADMCIKAQSIFQTSRKILQLFN